MLHLKALLLKIYSAPLSVIRGCEGIQGKKRVTFQSTGRMADLAVAFPRILKLKKSKGDCVEELASPVDAMNFSTRFAIIQMFATIRRQCAVIAPLMATLQERAARIHCTYKRRFGFVYGQGPPHVWHTKKAHFPENIHPKFQNY